MMHEDSKDLVALPVKIYIATCNSKAFKTLANKAFKTLANNIPTLCPSAPCDAVCCARGRQLDTLLSNTNSGVSYAHGRLKSYFFFLSFNNYDSRDIFRI